VSSLLPFLPPDPPRDRQLLVVDTLLWLLRSQSARLNCLRSSQLPNFQQFLLRLGLETFFPPFGYGSDSNKEGSPLSRFSPAGLCFPRRARTGRAFSFLCGSGFSPARPRLSL